MNKEIKNIVILRNILIYNTHHKRNYFTNDGIIIIEFEDNSRNILDIESRSDITNCDFLIPKIIKNKTKLETIFEEETLNRM